MSLRTLAPICLFIMPRETPAVTRRAAAELSGHSLYSSISEARLFLRIKGSFSVSVLLPSNSLSIFLYTFPLRGETAIRMLRFSNWFTLSTTPAGVSRTGTSMATAGVTSGTASWSAETETFMKVNLYKHYKQLQVSVRSFVCYLVCPTI